MPDDDQVGNTGNGIPTPLLGITLSAKGSEQAGEDHDDIGNDGDKDGGSVGTSQEEEVEEQQRRCQGPVNIAGPVDLSVEVVIGIRHLVIVLCNHFGYQEFSILALGQCPNVTLQLLYNCPPLLLIGVFECALDDSHAVVFEYKVADSTGYDVEQLRNKLLTLF